MCRDWHLAPTMAEFHLENRTRGCWSAVRCCLLVGHNHSSPSKSQIRRKHPAQIREKMSDGYQEYRKKYLLCGRAVLLGCRHAASTSTWVFDFQQYLRTMEGWWYQRANKNDSDEATVVCRMKGHRDDGCIWHIRRHVGRRGNER